MKRNKVNADPTLTPRASGKTHGARNIRRQKLFQIRACVRQLWADREARFDEDWRDLFTAVELAEQTGLPSAHLARELHRVGAQPVPRAGARKRLRDHEPQPQLWWLDDGPIPPYLSTVKDAWEEYKGQLRDAERRRAARRKELFDAIRTGVADEAQQGSKRPKTRVSVKQP